jgi:GH35 family endo-1,4-beta-xylanase
MRCAILIFLLAGIASIQALTVEADKARIKTVGGMTNGTWNIWSNGDWGDYFDFKDGGDYQVDVEARGTPAVGAWPQMEIVVDGDVIATTEVTTPDVKTFSFPLKIIPGLHRIVVRYTNDFKTDTEDRNLYVKEMTLKPGAGLSEPTLGNEADWLAQWKAKEEEKEKNVIGDAQADIEKFRKENATVTVKDANGQPVPGAQVKVEMTRNEFLFGGNIFGFDQYADPKINQAYKDRFAEIFNFATVGFYWRWYEPEQGHPNYAYTDKVLAWCKEHDIHVKGHPLLWGVKDGWPKWSPGLPSPEMQHARVNEIISKYKDRIGYWEVVNEPSHNPEPKIDDPYRWAHEADPTAQLIVNDFEVMANGYPPFYELLRKAKESGVPFNGIGIQSHEPEWMWFPLHKVKETLAHYAELGKDLYITEFTPESSGKPAFELDNVPDGKTWDEATQADYAVRFYTVCFANPAVKGITWWDLSDSGAWREGGGMLHADMSPKPVFFALKDLIHEKWTTKTQGQTDAAGNFDFRGFRGNYAIEVDYNGKTMKQEFALTHDGAKSVQVTLP